MKTDLYKMLGWAAWIKKTLRATIIGTTMAPGEKWWQWPRPELKRAIESCLRDGAVFLTPTPDRLGRPVETPDCVKGQVSIKAAAAALDHLAEMFVASGVTPYVLVDPGASDGQQRSCLIKLGRAGRPRNPLVEENLQEIVYRLQDRQSPGSIGRELGIPPTTIRDFRDDCGIDPPTEEIEDLEL
jgi:hypothetical protein